MRVINLAHAAMIVLAAFLTWWVWDRRGSIRCWSGCWSAPVMYAVGWLLYKTVMARVHRVDHELAMVASFGVAVAAGGVMSLIWGTEVRSATPRYFNESFELGSLAVPKAQLYACAGAVVLLAALVALLRGTFLGRRSGPAPPTGTAPLWSASTSSGRWRRCSRSGPPRPRSGAPRSR